MLIGHQGILAAGGSGVVQSKSLMATYSAAVSTLTSSVFYSPVGGSVWANSSDALRTALSPGVPGELSDVQNPGFVTNAAPGGTIFYQAANNRSTGTVLFAFTGGGVVTPTYSTGTVAVGASDEIQFYQTASGSTATSRGFLANFRHTGTGHVQIYGFSNQASISGSGVTRYTAVVGFTQSISANAAWHDVRVSVATRLLKAAFRFFGNTRTVDTTIQVLVNGVAVASAVQPAGSTADLTITINYDASANDTVRFAYVMGVGSGNFGLNGILVTNNLTSTASDLFVAQRTSIWNAASLQYTPLLSGAASSTANSGVLAQNQHTLQFRATLDTPQVYVSTNGGSAASIARLLVNGVASGVSVTIPVAAINQWITGTGSIEVGPNDLVAWECTSAVVSGGTGNANPTMLGIRCTYLSDS